MRRVIIVALAVLVIAGLLVDRARADGPSPQFPYAELAALAGLAAEEWLVFDEAAVVRERPALEWPTAARLEAGDRAALRAITPGEDPWLAVVLEGGASGWVRLAELDLPSEALARLPVRRASPIFAAPAENERIWLYGRPADQGDPARVGILEGDYTRPVLGRSLDTRWVALYSRWGRPTIGWARAEQIELLGTNLSAADLPTFIGELTALIPTDDPDGSVPAAGARYGLDSRRRVDRSAGGCVLALRH